MRAPRRSRAALPAHENETGKREIPEKLTHRVDQHIALLFDPRQSCPQLILYRSSGMFFILSKTVSRSSAPAT
jgi:hypothetical protein